MTASKQVPDFKRQIENIVANITDPEEFLKVKNEWHDTKTAVDFIARHLSTFPDRFQGHQYPIINLDELGEKERSQFGPVIWNMAEHGIVSYSKDGHDEAPPTQAGPALLVTSRISREMTGGKNIRVESREHFEKYRRSVLEAYVVIEQEGVKRFSARCDEQLAATFSVGVKDREIWVNDFLLSKPYSLKANKYFFDYVYDHSDQKLTREKMTDTMKNALGGKSFLKILNELGFKHEILKAFFPERGKSALLFRKSVSTEQLTKDGIDVDLLLQELRTASVRSSPK